MKTSTEMNKSKGGFVLPVEWIEEGPAMIEINGAVPMTKASRIERQHCDAAYTPSPSKLASRAASLRRATA